MKLINELLMFILMISKKYNIDESHDNVPNLSIYIPIYSACIHYNMLLIYGTFIS